MSSLVRVGAQQTQTPRTALHLKLAGTNQIITRGGVASPKLVQPASSRRKCDGRLMLSVVVCSIEFSLVLELGIGCQLGALATH